MTLRKLYDRGVLTDETVVVIRDQNGRAVTFGRWYQDNILGYLRCECKSYTWKNDGHLYFDLT